MQDDLTDGTRWLIDQKYADPARICIAGGSYGGYAALEGVTKEPDLYRCAAAWAPVTNLRELRGEILGTTDERLGDDRARLSAASPALHADRIKAPVLLVHGKQDFTVNFQYSEEMERALRRAGTPVEALYIEQSDHYQANYDSRLVWLSALDRFLGAQLGKP